ncbi:MAG: protein kinase [bacterium]|nr:MAG: protein kinase [bacterium]
MASDYFTCPQCGTRATKKKIVSNNYACPNQKCALNVRLLVHGEITNTGKVSKLYGWVLQPGTLLKKKYKIIKMIGKGGFGATYLARDKSMFDQLRAIKEIPRQYCDEKEDEFLTFLDHPAIPKLYERFNFRKFHYSVMEFIEGESLEEKVKLRSKGLAEAEVLKLTEQLLAVLKYIHSQNVVHRDLKPDNVLIRKDNKISLIDFGIAKKFHTGFGTRHLARAASSFYSSPEQYRAGKGYTDFQSDIYSTGAILYFISTGVEPSDALSRDPAKDITPLPRSLNSRLSKKLESVIVKAMKMKKRERFKNIEEMKRSLFSNGTTPSKKLCPKCQAAIGPNDKFCRNCGSATHPLKQSTTSSFVFNSKKKAKNIQQLVQICYQDWNEAIQHLYNRNFETWLKSVRGGEALAKKAVTIRKSQSDKHLGLNEFLMSSGYGVAPQIEVQPSKIKIGKLPRGAGKRIILTMTNRGEGYLKGSIRISVKWINISQKSFVCMKNMTTRLVLNVDTKPLSSDKVYQTMIKIHSNGGNISIPISISVASILYQPKSKSSPEKKSFAANSYVNPILLFLAIALLIRHLGPTSSISISKSWVIILMALLIGIANIKYGKIGFILGCLMGASLGAMMNIFSYFTYAFINQNIIAPSLKYLTASYNDKMSYAGWGIIGIYLGCTYALFKRRGRKL